MTSATERLRELLDERGVEWKDYGYENHTWWNGSENVGWHAENRPSANGLYVKIEAVLTPEQAIAATLGWEKCHMEKLQREDGIDPAYRCDACGHENYEFEWPCFCPNCGREVE